MDEKQDKGFPENLHDQDTEQEQQMRKDMSEEQCCALAEEKGFGEKGAHRCDQHGEVGDDLNDKAWLEKQQSMLPSPGMAASYEEEDGEERRREGNDEITES